MTGQRSGGVSKRARARRCALQALYQWQLAGGEAPQVLREFVADRETGNADQGLLDHLVNGVVAHAVDLEESLNAVLDRRLGDLDPVERVVLLLGAYELKYCPEVPWRVAINEAIDLEKMFGAEEGHRFVNNALDRLARVLRPVEAATATQV
jgi:N utilization substance protein B